MPDPLNILILGASGRLGRAMVRRYSVGGHHVRALSHAELDFEQVSDLGAKLSAHPFDVLINTAGLTDVDYCEAHPDLAQVLNADAPLALALHCKERGARFVQISTDYVFSGKEPGLLTEDSATGPINVYGRTKLDGELNTLQALPEALVLRVSWLFGLEKPSFPDRVMRQALERLDVSAVDDKWSSPTYADDVCDWVLAILSKKEAFGVYHLCNTGTCSWMEYGNASLEIAQRLGFPVKTTSVRGHTMDGFAPFLATRPRYTSLGTAKFTALTGIEPRRWELALEEYLRLRHVA